MNLSIRKFLFILLVIVSFGSRQPSQANEDVHDLAIGIGAGLVMMGIEAMSDSDGNDQENKSSTQSFETAEASDTAKQNLQYSQDTAEIQKNLKELGYYEGKIDGLNGQQTSQAIADWRKHIQSDVTGDLDFIEKDVLNDRAKTSRENRTHEQPKIQKVSNENAAPLEEAYQTYLGSEAMYKVCKEFQDSNHELSYQIDEQLTLNYQRSEKRLLKEIDKTKECLDIDDNSATKIQASAADKFKKSNIGQITDLALKAGPHVYVNEQDAYSRVQGCNVFSRKLKLLYDKLKDKPLTCSSIR